MYWSIYSNSLSLLLFYSPHSQIGTRTEIECSRDVIDNMHINETESTLWYVGLPVCSTQFAGTHLSLGRVYA